MPVHIKEAAVTREELKPIRPIRGGGMAHLTLAAGPNQSRCVIRELNRDMLFNWRLRQGFINGLRIRRALTGHQYILGSMGMKTRTLIPYEIVEYVTGGNLHELVLNKHSEVQCHHLDILRQIAAALAHMHNLGYVHLDVKAENVLVEADSQKHEVHVRLTDFDLSRHLSGSWRRVRSGTASHMAPEQLTGGRVGFGNDIFAFGVLAYCLTTGKAPFAGFTEEEARWRQTNCRARPEPPRRLCPGLALQLDEIIMACLEKDPGRRFPTMAYLEQELGRI